MKKIPLPHGKFVVVDDEDFERFNQFKWQVDHANPKRAYPFCRLPGIRNSYQKLHRCVIGATPGQVVDHINGNTLDCRKANLRIVTWAQNSQNRHGARAGKVSSVFRGVYASTEGRWRARIRVGGRLLHIGTYSTPLEAARAYAHKSKQYFGEFAGTCL